MSKKSLARHVAGILGASKVVDLGGFDHTPLGMAALTDRVRRLRSTGPGGTGRPSVPEATIPRIIKFRSLIWDRLRKVARAQALLTGRQVSPAQIASMLVEEMLGRPPSRRRRAQ